MLLKFYMILASAYVISNKQSTVSFLKYGYLTVFYLPEQKGKNSFDSDFK